jgi:hypothetical protein
MKTLLTVLFLLGSAFGQSLALGGVIGAQIVVPNVAYQFELCCGGPGSGHVGNGFDYSDGTFNLYYKGKGCLLGCTFTGTIDTWFAPQSLTRYCTIQSALLTGSLSAYHYYPNVEAEYSQMFCVKNGNHWSGPGGLIVHLQ